MDSVKQITMFELIEDSRLLDKLNKTIFSKYMTSKYKSREILRCIHTYMRENRLMTCHIVLDTIYIIVWAYFDCFDIEDAFQVSTLIHVKKNEHDHPSIPNIMGPYTYKWFIENRKLANDHGNKNHFSVDSQNWSFHKLI
jgi:hypothetical protein